MTIKLPYPPSINHYWRHNRGRHHVSSEGIAYRKAVMRLYEGRKHLGRLKLSMHVYPPDKRRRDLDNVLKSVLDSLEKARAYQDDSQIDHIEVIRGEKQEGGYVQVTIEEIAP